MEHIRKVLDCGVDNILEFDFPASNTLAQNSSTCLSEECNRTLKSLSNIQRVGTIFLASFLMIYNHFAPFRLLFSTFWIGCIHVLRAALWLKYDQIDVSGGNLR